MALLKEASEMFEETGCVPDADGEPVQAETMVPDAKEYISEVRQYIEQSFFSLVPNSFILSEEGFHSSATVN